MNKSVLIVDDDIQLRLALKHMLAREGCRVAEAADGAIALHMLTEAVYDLALVDLIMPNKEGIETIAEIRARFPRIKVIAMSGGARLHAADPLEMALDSGADFVMAKPFLPADLRALLRRCWPET